MQINQSLTANGLYNSQSQKLRASVDGGDPNAAAFQAPVSSDPESRRDKDQGVPGGVTFRSTSLPSVDTIMEYWGTANAIADLNTDGIVDSADLGMVLSATPPADEGGTAGEGGTASDPTVDTIMSNWGTSNPDADLNGDGTVDSADLGIVLSGMPPAGDEGGTASDPTVDTIMSNWGTSNPDADLNGDGTVDSADLGIVLSGMPPAGDGGTAGDEDAPPAQRIAQIEASIAGLHDALGFESRGSSLAQMADIIVKALDGDGDGLLKPSDVPGNPKLFHRFDSDGDLLLGKTELLEGLQREFAQYSSESGDPNLGPFAKRWLAAFQGLLPEPAYDNRQAVLASRFGLTGSADAIAAQSPSFLSVRA